MATTDGARDGARNGAQQQGVRQRAAGARQPQDRNIAAAMQGRQVHAPGSAGGGGAAVAVAGNSSTSNPPAESNGGAASQNNNVDKWKGRRVKRFKLVDELGEGAMGRVFLAEDTVLKRHVALKLLPARHRDGRPNHRTERLVREARSAASLEHPNAVQIHEIDQSGGVHYIAMELVEGGNLEKLVELSGPMEVERACQLIAEAAEALAHAHTRGIVHRDVKPANLLLSRSGRCKVCDFGLALFDDELDGDGRTKCVGTPYYIAPEVAQGHGATSASDLYSLGCTLFYLLCGRAPFAGASARDLMKAHITQPLPDLRQWRADLPDRLVGAIEQACAKNPAQRFESTEHFAKLLRTFTISPGGSGSALPYANGNGNNNGGNGSGNGSNGGFGSGSIGIDGMPPISAAQLEAILPAAALQAGQKRKSHMLAALLWTSMGTIAATALIGLGVWMARSANPQNAVAAPVAPTPELKVEDAAPEAAPVTPAPALTPGETAVGQALANGTMEETDVTDGVGGWFIHDRFKPQVQVLTENDNRFLRLTNTDPAKTVFVDQRINVDPAWKALNVSARMRATGFKVGKTASQDARVAFAFRDEKDVRVGNWPPVPTVKTDSPWVERTVTVDVPKGAKTMYVQLAIFNATGTVDFDDVKIVPQTSP